MINFVYFVLYTFLSLSTHYVCGFAPYVSVPAKLVELYLDLRSSTEEHIRVRICLESMRICRESM